MRESVEDREPNNMFDGHINRNLRLSTAMIDMSKPYIYITQMVQVDKINELYEVHFKVNGCATIDQVYVLRNGEKEILTENIEAYCNHRVPKGKE
jgi:hypothetical protein